MTEEQLFNRFKTLTAELMDTAAVVQNDYEWLTDNRAITLDQIKEDYWRFLKRIEEHKKELDALCYDTQMRLSEIMQEMFG
jgi:hypothetical protein